MEKRTNLYAEGDTDGIKALEKELLAQNAEHKDWCCTEELMATTKDGKALYLHCLPADINDVSCKDGEVEASVFRPLSYSSVQRGKLQAIHHRSYDPACKNSSARRRLLQSWLRKQPRDIWLNLPTRQYRNREGDRLCYISK